MLLKFVRNLLGRVIKQVRNPRRYTGQSPVKNLDDNGRVWFCRFCDYTEFTGNTVTKLYCPWCKKWCEGHDI